MVFSYYPGCTLKSKAQDLDFFARQSAAALGFTLDEVDEWQCCGAVYPLGADEIVAKLPAIRALKSGGKGGRTLVTLCSACHHVLKHVNADMRDDATLRTAVCNYDDELDYDGSTPVLHYLEVIKQHVGFDELAKRVTNPLKGRKIGAYYGCMLLRPSGVMAFDDPENPTIFEEFLRALGVDPIPFPLRNECCGGYISLKQEKKAAEMACSITKNASDRGAELLIAACPLCQYNISQKAGDDVPIAYFTELLAEALGIGTKGATK